MGAGFAAGVLSILFLAPGYRPSLGAKVPGAAESLEGGALGGMWKSLLDPKVDTIVAFSNPVFLRTESSGVQFNYDGPVSAPTGARIEIAPSDPVLSPELLKKVGPFYFSDGWTGTGEVLAVHKLTRLFHDAGHSLKVRRSRALAFEDLHSANVIFVGSPRVNLILDKLKLANLPFSCCGDREVLSKNIINHNPRPGEAPDFSRVLDARTQEIAASYSLFSVLPGVSPNRKIVVSSGLTTHGSWGAIDFMTSSTGQRQLVDYFRTHEKDLGPGGLPVYFQAVIRTNVIHGEADNTSLITARAVATPAPVSTLATLQASIP